MATPAHPAAYVLGAISLMLGIVVSAATAYVIGATGFWLVETRGVALLYMVVSGFLAGLFVPIGLFPVRDSFQILAAIHSLSSVAERERTDELVERLELGELLGTPVRQLSLGQRMRAEVAAALLHSPRLVVLDEPTIGLDVLSKQRLREFLVAERRTHGTTLLLTTHDMGDVERLCDRILLVDRGTLIFDGTLDGLSRTVGAERVMVVDLATPTADLLDVPHTRHLGGEGSGLRQRLAFDPDATTAARVLAAVSERAEVLDLAIEEPDVEDVVRRVYASRR